MRARQKMEEAAKIREAERQKAKMKAAEKIERANAKARERLKLAQKRMEKAEPIQLQPAVVIPVIEKPQVPTEEKSSALFFF